MLDLHPTIPFTEEDQIVGRSLLVAEGTVTAISNLPTIHSNRIDVVLEALTNSVDVTIRMYGASQNAFTDTALGTVALGTTVGFIYGSAAGEWIGQQLDIRVLNSDGATTGVGAVYTLWVGARS